MILNPDSFNIDYQVFHLLWEKPTWKLWLTLQLLNMILMMKHSIPSLMTQKILSKSFLSKITSMVFVELWYYVMNSIVLINTH